MSNLLEKASIVTTPTAYDNGKILSVKPVPSLGSELITNGDFTNGSTGWTLGSGWSIGAGVANASGSVNANISQNSFLTIGSKYEVTYTVLNASTGARVGLAPNGSTVQNIRTENGTYTEIYEAINASFYIRNLWNNGVGLSITNVSVKEVIDGDFDFTRNSSATRVNSQGLIEDVQILSSNLVSNGDFSQEGSELITNGDFATDSDWNLRSSWVISNGNCSLTPPNSDYLSQSNVLTSNKSYKLTFDIIVNSGNLQPQFFDGGFQTIGTYNTTQTVEVYFKPTSSGTLYFKPNLFDGSIDNVSVKEVGQDWTLSNAWSIGTNKAIFSDTIGGDIRTSSNVFTANKKYQIKLTVADLTSGTAFFGVGDGAASNLANYANYANGEHTFNVTAPIGQELRIYSTTSSGSSYSITNISVIEITDDTNLPRIDYTGGEGHWLFEPQSTNLIPYSSDFSQWSLGANTQLISSNNLAPSGELNAYKFKSINTVGNTYVLRQVGGLINNTTYTFSTWVRADNPSAITVGKLCALNITNGGQYTYIDTSELTTEWKRVSVTATSATSSTAQCFLATDWNVDSEIEFWGAQLEVQSYATSYIPTNGSTVTRLQDAAFGAGSSDLINSTEGVLYAEIASFISTDATEPNRYLTLTNGTSNQRIALLFGGNTNQLRAIAYSNTQSINLSFTTSNTDAKQFNKLAIKYKSGDYAFFLNGIKIGGSTEANIFTADTLNDLSFDVGGGTQKFRGKVKCVAVFKEALTDEELECLTTI